MWIFGYGSIIWKVDFEHKRTIIGYIKGYVRRFYQGSTDHRGTPEKPGRVVTLLPATDDEDNVVWGVAYELPEEKCEEILSHLDYREKGGFVRVNTTFYPRNDQEITAPFSVIVYIAKEGNQNYLGPAPIAEIAKQIHRSIGPSGPNRDYLINLAKSLREIAPNCPDPHITAVEQEFLAIENGYSSSKNDQRST